MGGVLWVAECVGCGLVVVGDGLACPVGESVGVEEDWVYESFVVVDVCSVVYSAHGVDEDVDVCGSWGGRDEERGVAFDPVDCADEGVVDEYLGVVVGVGVEGGGVGVGWEGCGVEHGSPSEVGVFEGWREGGGQGVGESGVEWGELGEGYGVDGDGGHWGVGDVGERLWGELCHEVA